VKRLDDTTKVIAVMMAAFVGFIIGRLSARFKSETDSVRKNKKKE